MSTHKQIDKLCLAAVCLALILCAVFVNAERFGVEKVSEAAGYETRLFDTSQVHTIDIVMDDWEGFLESCENEQYEACSVVIDGEALGNVGIRAKGNTSLSSVAAMDSDRYSFKIEFDQYENGKNYYGLDKLSLNNLIQDATMMKEYLTYRLMNSFGVAAPLCSYVYITVNGEDWGLYLAVEGVEDAFLQRNYGSDHGELYKPDSMNFGGGGPGNGKDFDLKEWMENGDGEMPGDGRMPEMPQMEEKRDVMSGVTGADVPSGAMHQIPSMNPSESFGSFGEMPQMGGFGGGMGSSDVKLQYTDDDPDSYSNLFQQAKTDISQEDQKRLIQSLKALGEEDNIENVVDMDSVLRYFVVHNFVVNGDSYTGSMIHNYYLYEEDGMLTMIPWDYNLAFGTFQGRDATASVNDPIDTPLSVTGSGDRPMADWIFGNEEYLEQYHEYFRQFLENSDVAGLIDETVQLLAPYVEKDPTKFYSVEEFQAGVEAIREFCRLREESVRGQLNDTIPSTKEGQSEDASALVDASQLTLSDMGMGKKSGREQGEWQPGRNDMGIPGVSGGERFPGPPSGKEGGAA